MEVMTLGRVRTLGAAMPPSKLPPPPVDWTYAIGAYAGAWAGGAGVGYVVGRSKGSALVGGLAAGGIWGIGEAITNARARNWGVTVTAITVAAASLYFAWQRNLPW